MPFSHPEAGYQRDTGGQSFYPDAIWWDGQIVIAETNSSGQLPASLPSHSLAEPRKPYSVAATPPPPPPPVDPPEPPPMPEIPDYFEHVQRVWAKHGGTSEEAGAKVTRIVAYDLANGLNGAPKDPRVGLYRKRSASTIQDRDPDKLCFNLGGGRIAFVDIVANAGAPDAHASWQAPHFETDDNTDDFTSWVPADPEPGVHDGTTPPTPLPPNPPPPSDVQAQLDGLRSIVAGLAGSVVDHERRLKVLEDVPELPPVPPLPGKLRAKGKTSAAGGGWWGKSHQHDIDVEVVPE